jgi:hypothetical protein
MQSVFHHISTSVGLATAGERAIARVHIGISRRSNIKEHGVPPMTMSHVSCRVVCDVFSFYHAMQQTM